MCLISQVWYYTLVVPALRRAKAGGSLVEDHPKPHRKFRSGLDYLARPSLKTNKPKKNQNKTEKRKERNIFLCVPIT